MVYIIAARITPVVCGRFYDVSRYICRGLHSSCDRGTVVGTSSHYRPRLQAQNPQSALFAGRLFVFFFLGGGAIQRALFGACAELCCMRRAVFSPVYLCMYHVFGGDRTYKSFEVCVSSCDNQSF